jgi:hypothetical protein
MPVSRIIIALAVLALTAGMSQAVTFGQPDNSQHPYVGTILFTNGDGNWYSCSATLISPTVLVTAAHCTIDNGVKNTETWVNFSEHISFADRASGESLTHYLSTHTQWIRANDVVPHELYTGSYPNTYDIGVVVLGTPVISAIMGELPTLRFLDGIRPGNTPENSFTVVGYGMQGYIKPFYGDDWARRAGQTRLIELKSTFDGAEMSAKYSNNPGKTSGGSCYGDSGGPVFYKNTNMIVSVVSWGITPCIGVEYNFRTDTPVAQDFLYKYITRQ